MVTRDEPRTSDTGDRTMRTATMRTWVALACLTALVAALGAPWKWY